jgi:hypothetical protein
MSEFGELIWNRLAYIVAFGIAGIVLAYFLAAAPDRREDTGGAAAAADSTGTPVPSGASIESPASGGGDTDAGTQADDPGTGARSADGSARIARADSTDAATDTPAASGAGDRYVPIPVPAELAAAFERDEGLRRFHEALEREPEDAAWATATERQLADFIGESFDLSEFIVHLIECRSQSCEVLVTGYGEDAFRTWVNGMSVLFESESFGDGGDSDYRAGCGGGDLGPGVFALNCTFTQADSVPGDAPADEAFSLDAPYDDGVMAERVSVPDMLVPLIEAKPEVYELHRQLEIEHTDIGWSDFIETQIIDHFAEIPELESLTVLGVECRTTLCEVQIVMEDPSEFGDWLAEMMAFHDESWHDLATVDLNGDDVGEDRMGIVWLLQRSNGN